MVLDAGLFEDGDRLADALDPTFVVLIQCIGDHLFDSALGDCNRTLHAGAEGRIDRTPDGRDSVASALDDRIEFRMNREVVLDRSLESVRRVLESSGKSVESGSDDLS